MKVLEFASMITKVSEHYDFTVFSLLATISPVVPPVPCGEEEFWSNLHGLFIGEIGIGKSSLLMKIAKVAPKYDILDKTTEGSLAGIYDPARKDIAFPVIESAQNGVIISTEFDKVMANKRLQGHIRRILEKYPIKAWSRGRTRVIIPNVSLLASANPKEDVFTTARIADSLVFQLGVVNRFDFIKIAKQSKEHIRKLAELIVKNIGKNGYETTYSRIKHYITNTYRFWYGNSNYRIVLKNKHIGELTKIFLENSNPENNPLHNIRVLISAIKIMNVSVAFHYKDRKSRGKRFTSESEDLELTEMFLKAQLDNLTKLYSYISKDILKENRWAKILKVYSIIRKLSVSKGKPVKLAEVIRESEKEKIASENTIRKYVEILEREGYIKRKLENTVYYVYLLK